MLLSHGTPMLLAGDEFGQTQHGNNNAYAQDNETAWLDWMGISANGRSLREFARKAGLKVQSCEHITRERRPPHFEVLSLQVRKPER